MGRRCQAFAAARYWHASYRSFVLWTRKNGENKNLHLCYIDGSFLSGMAIMPLKSYKIEFN